MASRSPKKSAPLTFDLPLGLITKIKAARKSRGLKSASEVVRLAIEGFDFEACRPSICDAGSQPTTWNRKNVTNATPNTTGIT